jgi:two-component system sensor histidine kinase SenX3
VFVRRPKPQAQPSLPPLPEIALETARAFGGYAIVVTPSHQVVYRSDDAAPLPWFHAGELIHPGLVRLVDEAWADRETVTDSFTEEPGPITQAEVRATRLADRYVLVTVADMTETAKAREIRHDFIANIGHELRTPITAVDLISSTLDAAADDPETVRRFSRRLAGEAGRLARLTEDVLALAKAQDRNVAYFESVSLTEVVDQAVNRHRTASEAKNIRVNVTRKSAPVVWGDKAALITAVENLVANAISYSAQGSKIDVTTWTHRAGDVAFISVADRGIGIDVADQERIFERFYRADQARSRRTGGTGLGLSIVRNTVANHGGSISVRSRVGSGSTFTIHLPLFSGQEDRA